jgi:carbonic anhydrase
MKFLLWLKVAILLLLVKDLKSMGKEQTVFGYYNTLLQNGDKLAEQNPSTQTVTPLLPPGAPDPTIYLKQGHSEQAPLQHQTNPTKEVQQIPSHIIDLNDPDIILADWISISVPRTGPKSLFSTNGKSDDSHVHLFSNMDQGFNTKFEIATKEGAKFYTEFWFRVRSGIVYFGATKEEVNISSILVKYAKDIPAPISTSLGTFYCFSVFDYKELEYKLCSTEQAIKVRWVCSLQHFYGRNMDPLCGVTPENHIPPTVEKKVVKQEVIIIPTASRSCNQNWTYNNNGKDWECICSEGRLQSPIDLPAKSQTVSSSFRPRFEYPPISNIPDFDSIEGLIRKGEKLKIRHDRGALRIHYPKLGKISYTDGTRFNAEEIVFHTPSEHTIENERFDMEMQIIHYGRTKGDIAKQTVLSFLFKKTPGVYNKFIDSLDFFNLPNGANDYRDLNNDIAIEDILLNTDEMELGYMRPFSFYSYEGSLTSPPCTERTNYFIHADPIPLSNTVIDLFKEAISNQDTTDDNGEVILTAARENYRATQPANDRQIIYYDHIKFGCPTIKKEVEVEPEGHYEKREIDKTEYLYVNGKKPSGLPNSFVVTPQEAKNVNEINFLREMESEK